MSWNLSLYGHTNDPEKQAAVLSIVRDAASALDSLADYDGGDTFGGTFSGPNVSISFPEIAVAAPDGTETAAVVPDGQEAEAATPGENTGTE